MLNHNIEEPMSPSPQHLPLTVWLLAASMALLSPQSAFAEDLLQNQTHPTAESRFSLPFGRTLVETDVKVRSAIAYAWSVPRCDTIHNQQEFPHP